MSIDYRKPPKRTGEPAAQFVRRSNGDHYFDVVIDDRQRMALAAVNSSLLRLERTRADVDTARATNDDPMRKRVRVPWGEFFRALDQHTAHVRTLLAAFNVQ